MAGILITALLSQTFGWAMVTFMSVGILGICSLSIGYILKQGALDAFMRGVSSLKGKTNDDSDNSME